MKKVWCGGQGSQRTRCGVVDVRSPGAVDEIASEADQVDWWVRSIWYRGVAVGRLSTAGIFRCGGPGGESWAWSISKDLWGNGEEERGMVDYIGRDV